ncbi:MAG TPA: hypothetical protein VEA18_01710 [Candidatus Kapabacteria bacterium]|nr:hypothetical protein [Candidatus Kapabacteria bacterium]
MHFHRNNNRNHQPRHGQQQPQGRPVNNKVQQPVQPARVYTDADLHVDVVDLSFNDVRRVQSGTYPNGEPIVEYLSEKEATDRGFLDQWKNAQPIDEYRQSSND